jgi:hypothetical protein
MTSVKRRGEARGCLARGEEVKKLKRSKKLNSRESGTLRRVREVKFHERRGTQALDRDRRKEPNSTKNERNPSHPSTQTKSADQPNQHQIHVKPQIPNKTSIPPKRRVLTCQANFGGCEVLYTSRLFISYEYNSNTEITTYSICAKGLAVGPEERYSVRIGQAGFY